MTQDTVAEEAALANLPLAATVGECQLCIAAPCAVAPRSRQR